MSTGASLAFFRALPPYQGGKRRLCRLIFAALSEVLPRHDWTGKTFLDPMCGGGAVALFAKAMGFNVFASDIARRGSVVAAALIENSAIRLTEQDIRYLFDPAWEPAHPLQPEVARLMTPEQARWFSRARGLSELPRPPKCDLLQLLLVKQFLGLFPLSLPSATDAPAAALGDFDRLSPPRLGHYLKARQPPTPDSVWRVAQDVNRGVLPGLGWGHSGNACSVIEGVEADVLYIDPPYPGTSRYERAYGPLDLFLNSPSLRGGRGPTTAGISELLSVGDHIPVAVISYGGPAVTLNGLIAQVERHRHVVKAIEIPYRHLESIASEKKNATNREFLVIAIR